MLLVLWLWLLLLVLVFCVAVLGGVLGGVVGGVVLAISKSGRPCLFGERQPSPSSFLNQGSLW